MRANGATATVIALASMIVLTIALFGANAARIAFADVATLETQEAARQAAIAAAGRAASLIVGGASDYEVNAALRDEAESVSAANITRGSWRSAVTTRTASSEYLVYVQVTVTVDYGGFAGPLHLVSAKNAYVLRPAGG